MPISPKPTFEESIGFIDIEIKKRKAKWTLNILSWMDYDDVSQILRLHIYKKWHLYDPAKPLGPWINSIISHQLINLIRNNYGNYSRPCLKCAAAEGENLCSIYGKQCVDCPLYANWVKYKKSAHDSKLPVALENHAQEVSNIIEDFVDVEQKSKVIHEKMKLILKPFEWRIYKLLFIDNKTEEEAAKQLNYKSNEKGRSAGYKHIKNVKKAIITKVKELIASGDIEI